MQKGRSDDSRKTLCTAKEHVGVHPTITFEYISLFHFPSKIVDWVGWLLRSWLPLTERLVFFALAWGSWVWLTPQLEAGAPLSLSWISIVWAKNLGLMVALAGGLHLYLYRWGRQGKALKFDTSMSNKIPSALRLAIRFMIICSGHL